MNNPNAYPPLGIVHLGTQMRDEGEEVYLHDMTWDRDYEPVREVIKNVKPATVGLSTLSIAYGISRKVAELARHLSVPEIVLGGAHACTGVQDWPYRLHKGPYYFRKTLIPDRRLLSTFEKYLRQNPGFPYLMPWTYVIASRGCPFDCSFCQPVLRKMFGRKVQHRTVDSVEEEIRQIKSNYKIKSFTFMDDTMISNVEWLEEMCQRLRRIELPWTAQTNIRTVTWDRLKMMRDAGCYFIGMGVESGSEWINKHVYNKPQTKEQIRKAFDMCDKLDILTEATLIIGAPEDTKETIDETGRLMREIGPDVIDLHFLTPTPGSRLYDEYIRRGVLTSANRESLNRYTAGTLLGILNGTELKRAYWKVIRKWLEGKSLWRVQSFWGKWLWTLRGRARLEGLVRFLIYHSYFWHRTLKSIVWWWRGRHRSSSA